MNYPILSLIVLMAFYAVYLGKLLMQRRQGIRTDQIGRGDKPKRVLRVERIMKLATCLIIPAELFCILRPGAPLPEPLRMLGLALGAVGDAVFALSVFTMRDSWRAGISPDEHTELVTSGIYSISRNPAFLGFDLVYVGILLMNFRWVLLAFTLWAMVMLHLQILQEEAFCATAFGQPYRQYRAHVRRYLGRRP